MNADFTDQASLRARLRIGSIGPFYFAWADKNEAFDPAVHARIDEDIFKFDVDHSEGDFATLTAIVRNPRIGLLAPSRRVWAWLSWQNGADLVPLFYGRLVGVPTDINQELVTLVFTARPADFVALKAAKAETLKVRPYYDPIWINPDALDDPDTVLEARSALWSIDRVTHEVDISDVLVGEDGIEDFGPDEVPYDSVKINLGETPLRSVSVDATINWTQSASGTLALRPQRCDLHRAIADFGLAEARRDARRRLDGCRRLGARSQRCRERRYGQLHRQLAEPGEKARNRRHHVGQHFKLGADHARPVPLHRPDAQVSDRRHRRRRAGQRSDQYPGNAGKHRALRAALAGPGEHDAEIRRQPAAQGACALYADDRCAGHRHAGRGRRCSGDHAGLAGCRRRRRRRPAAHRLSRPALLSAHRSRAVEPRISDCACARASADPLALRRDHLRLHLRARRRAVLPQERAGYSTTACRAGRRSARSSTTNSASMAAMASPSGR